MSRMAKSNAKKKRVVKVEAVGEAHIQAYVSDTYLTLPTICRLLVSVVVLDNKKQE